MKSQPSIRQKVIIDATLIALAVVLLILASPSGFSKTKHEVPSFFLGLYLVYLGVLFLMSYFFSGSSYVLRVLMWVCEDFSHPRGRYMAFFYFGLLVLIGGCALLSAFGLRLGS
jgi:apolipoprotein N-acyltransferase